MNQPARGPGLRERFRAQARDDILDATVRVIVRDGLTEARVDAVATEAGVSVGTIYNLFGDRSGLLVAAIERGREELFAGVRTYLRETGELGFRPRLHGFVRVLTAHMRAHWPLLRAITEAESRVGVHHPPGSPPPSALREVYELVRGLVQHGVSEGALAEVDEHVATCALLGTMRETIFLDLLLGLDAPDEARADAIVKLYLEGAARRP